MKLKAICLLILVIGLVTTLSYAGTLSFVTATPDDNQAGATTLYTFNFSTDASGIPADGK